MKQFKNLILAGALAVGLAGFAVSCNKYGDDIDDLNKQVGSLAQTVEGLQAQLKSVQDQVSAGNYVTNVSKSGEGIVITWSNGQTSTIETIKGDKGETGDVVSIEIDPETKHWIIGGVDTGIVAEGKDGANGKDGVNGTNGKDGADGKDGANGKDGADGKDGKSAPSPQIDPTTGNWIVYAYDEETGEYEETLTDISAKGASAYVVDMGDYYELHIAADEAGTEMVTIKLPKTAASSELANVDIIGWLFTVVANENGNVYTALGEAYNEEYKSTYGEGFLIGYDYTFVNKDILNELDEAGLDEFVEHGGKSPKKGQVLAAYGDMEESDTEEIGSYETDILIRVTPASLDASKLSFKLVNTAGKEAPVVLGTPERFDGVLVASTGSTRASNNTGLWKIHVAMDETAMFESGEDFDANFIIPTSDLDMLSELDLRILFALQEEGGYSSKYEVKFINEFNSETPSVAFVNGKSVEELGELPENYDGDAEYFVNEVKAGEKVVIAFDFPKNVYDAHLDIDEKDITLWGIKNISRTINEDGTLSFDITKVPDDVTLPEFPVTVHYLWFAEEEADIEEETILFRALRSYTGNVTLKEQHNVLRPAAGEDEDPVNNLTYSLDDMFSSLGSKNNIANWKKVVGSYEISDVYYYRKNGQKVSIESEYSFPESEELFEASLEALLNDEEVVILKAGKEIVNEEEVALNEVTDIELNLDALVEEVVFKLNTTYYVEITFKDDADNLLNVVTVPFSVSIPALSEVLEKEFVVFGGTNTGKAYLDASFSKNVDYPFYSAFKNIKNTKDNTSVLEVAFEIDAKQKIDGTLATDLATIKDGSYNQFVRLTQVNGKYPAYGQPIHFFVTKAVYMGLYGYDAEDDGEEILGYTEDDLDAAAFYLKVMSPIEQGNIAPATGKTVEVVATAGIAKITDSNISATTYAGVSYSLFKVKGASYEEPALAEVSFSSANTNAFVVLSKNGEAHSGAGKGDGYVPIQSKNVGYEEANDLNVVVTDIWGFTKKFAVPVTVKPEKPAAAQN